MIQSTGNSTQTRYGFESLARSAVQAEKPTAARSRGTEPVEDSTSNSTKQLSAEQQRQVAELKQTDREVRAHEQAHLAVGRDLVRGGASYTYQTGPDNKRYAVAGEVSIDTSPGRTPEETIPKAQHIRATALAPAEPSPQDQSVAAKASRMETAARTQLAIEQRAEAANQSQDTTQLYVATKQDDAETASLGQRLDLFV